MGRSAAQAIRLAILLTVVALVATACRRVEATPSDPSDTPDPAPQSITRDATDRYELRLGPGAVRAAALYDRSNAPDLAQQYITRDGTDRYVLELGPGAVRASAPESNQGTELGSDTRSVIWPPSTTATRDQQSCATWTDASGPWLQQGIALRVRVDGDRLRTIVVAKNIVYGVEWQFNVYTWDTDRDPFFQTHGAVNLAGPFEVDRKPRPLPWKVCARAEGRIVRVKGWHGSESEPTWTDPTHTGSVTLPNSWSYDGKAGWYVGHIAPGGTLGMSDLRTSTWVLRPDS